MHIHFLRVVIFFSEFELPEEKTLSHTHSDGAFELQFSFLTVCNEEYTYAIGPAAHKNHQTIHLAGYTPRKKEEKAFFKAANGNVIIIKYLWSFSQSFFDVQFLIVLIFSERFLPRSPQCSPQPMLSFKCTLFCFTGIFIYLLFSDDLVAPYFEKIGF